MKVFKKLTGVLLAVLFVITLTFGSSFTSEASYTYRVRVILGGTIPTDDAGNRIQIGSDEDHLTNVEQASFDADYVTSLNGKLSTDKQVMLLEGEAYGEEIEIPFGSLVKLGAQQEGNTCYYPKGLRIAGGNDIIKPDATGNIKVAVTGDEDYVVAYGVGKTVSYKVNYLNKETNAPMPGIESDVYYGAVGQVVYAPARHIDGFYPDAIYKTSSAGLLAHDEEHPDGTVFNFYYSKYSGGVIPGEDIITEENSTITGSGSYEYQYATRNRTVPGNTTVGGAGRNAGGNAGAGDADANDAEAGNGAGDATIEDEEAPRDVIDIDDEEVAKAGGAKEHFVRDMLVGIIIALVAIISILVALYIADRKRKFEIARFHDKDKE